MQLSDEASDCNFHNQPDFAHLPDIVWVKVLSQLSLGDRYNLSVCCHALNDAFHHPSLWHTVEISLFGPASDVPKKYYCLVKKFAHCFQDFALKIVGDLHYLPEDWLNILVNLEASGCYHLKKLTLEVGVTKSQNTPSDSPPDPDGLRALLGYIRSAVKLKSLIIKAWPIHNFLNDNNDILHVILQNNHLRENLETLSLYWPKKNDWVTKNGRIPPIDKTKLLINHLFAVQYLSLQTCMLDEEVIKSLASEDHAPLQRLEVLMVYSPFDNLFIPEISSEAWRALKEQSPHLEVECSVMNRIPCEAMSPMLKPEVPLVAITFLKYSLCDGEILLSLASKYRKTLKKLIEFSSEDASDGGLLEIVEQCKQLTYLVYHRSVHFTTVQRLAAMRGKNWEQFEFKEKSIDTQDLEDDDARDTVIDEIEPGVYVIKDFRKFHEDPDIRQSRMTALISSVRESVGYHWFPLEHSEEI